MTLSVLSMGPHSRQQVSGDFYRDLIAGMRNVGEGRVVVRVTRLAPPAWGASGEPGAGPALQIDVVDDGPGIPESIRERIFSPFYTTKPRGSGLGLAIVRKLVDAHQGQIELHAGGNGLGTCFRLTLPVRPLTDGAVAVLPDAGAPGGPRPR